MPTYPLTHIPTNCSPPPPLTPLSSHTCHPRPAPTQAPRDQPPHPLPACPLIPPHMHAHPILPHRTPLHTVTHTHTPSIITLPTPTLTSPRTATHIHSPSHQLVAADLLVPACPHATSGRQLRSVGRGMLRQQAGVCSVQKAGDRAPGAAVAGSGGPLPGSSTPSACPVLTRESACTSSFYRVLIPPEGSAPITPKPPSKSRGIGVRLSAN